jgi:membrane protein YqaA with SNARE-associated domain
MDLAVLFLSALGASTILPMSSEAVLAAMTMTGNADRALLFLIATAGNTLGSVINWLLGRYAGTWVERRMAGQRPAYERAVRWFQRFGIWSLLLSWLPVVGDPLTLVAGLLRTPFLPFVTLVLIGKAARYAAVLMAVG